MTYTAGSPTGNVVIDQAGNELGTIIKNTADAIAPILITGMVLNPNGTSAETITFQLSEELNLAEGASAVGFSVSEGSIATALYTGKGTTNTITLTSGGDGQWTDNGTPVIVSYTQSGVIPISNVKDLSTNELANIVNEQMLLKSVNIVSNNSTNTTYATAGNIVTLTFTTSRTLTALPDVFFDPSGANITGSVSEPSPGTFTGPFTVTATMTGGVTQGVIPFTINVTEATKATLVTATTIPSHPLATSSVTFDNINPPAPSNPVLATGDDSGPSNADNYTNVTDDVTFSGTSENGATIQIRNGTTVLGTTIATGTNWTIDIDLTEGTYALNARAFDAAGNSADPASISGNLSLTIDTTPPAVSNITLPDANPNNTTGVNFTVIFNTPVDGVDATDFSTYGAGGAGTTIGTPVVNSSVNYTIPVSGVAFTGPLGLSVNDDGLGNIIDLAGNQLGGPTATDGDFGSATAYEMILPEPTNHVPLPSFVVSGTPTTTGITLTWTDATGGTIPSGYLISAERSPGSATPPGEFGTKINDQPDLVGSNTGYLNVPAGVQTANFTNLLSGQTYIFRIYPYTNDNSSIDYKITGTIPSTSGATTTSADATIGIQTVQSGTISSTGTYKRVLHFFVNDIGFSNGDNADTKVSSIVIRRNTAVGQDGTGGWANVIASAELIEDPLNGTAVRSNVPRVASGADITNNSITFNNLSSDAFGVIGQGTNKHYYLSLSLKTPMDISVRGEIDQNIIRLILNRSDITLASGSTTFPGAGVTVMNSNIHRVEVLSTQLDFSTSPDATQLVFTNVTSTVPSFDLPSTTPVIRARDAFGNTDENFGGIGVITLTSPVAFSPSAVIDMIGGKAEMPAFQYLDVGDGTLTASTSAINAIGGVPTSGNSSPVAVNYSELTTLTSGTVNPLSTNNCCVQIYTFTITDDGGPGLGDGSPTRISSITLTKKASASAIPDWRDFLDEGVNGGALLYDGTSSWSVTTKTINQNNIIIGNMLSTGTTADLGYIGDGLSKQYTLYIYPDQSSMPGGLSTTVDDLNFDVEIDPALINFTTQSSDISPAQLPIGTGPVDVDVAATQLVFNPQPPADVLVNTDLTTSPVVQAQDPFGNLDLDYAPSTGITISNTGVLTTINAPTAFTDGVLTFPTNFQYTQIGNGTLTVASSTVATGLSSAPTSATSSPATTVRVGVAGTITAGPLAEPGTIASTVDLTHTPAGLEVFDFIVNDDPGTTPANQNDGSPTRISSITINQGAGNTIGNWSNALAQVQLDDGAGHVVNGAINPTTLVFSGLTNTLTTHFGHIQDNASKTYTLKIWLRTTLLGGLPTTIDGSAFAFNIAITNNPATTSITTDINGSTLLIGEDENSGPTNNVVTVDAIRLDVTTPSAASFVSINAPFTPVIVARDVNANIDLDFEGALGTVTAFSNSSGATMANGAIVATTQFNNGVLTLPSFRFTTGNNGDNVTLAMSAGPGPISTVTTPTLTLKTNTITAGTLTEPALMESFRSTPALAKDVFDFTINDDDLQITGTDALPTLISQIVITKLAGQNDILDWRDLIDPAGATLLDNAGNPALTGTVNEDNITFSSIPTGAGLAGNIGDNLSKTYTLKIYLKPTLGVTLRTTVDNLNIAFEVLADNITTLTPVTTSSSFSSSADGNLADVEDSGAGTNAIDVIATNLEWMTDPASSLLVNKDISLQLPIPVIEAVDVNNNRDLNYVTSLNITNAQALSMSGSAQSNVTTFSLVADGSAPLSGGIYTFPGNFQFETIGNGAVGNGRMTALPGTAGSVVANGTTEISSSVTVRVAVSGTITASATLTEPAEISSLADDGGGTASGGTDVFDFEVNDDPSGTPALEDDGNPLRISSIKITPGDDNTIGDWSQAIGAARLSDGTNTLFGAVSADAIEFTGITNNLTTELGHIEDDDSKTYTLRIWLREDMGTLSSSIDGEFFEFEVLSTLNVETDPNGTAVKDGENASSGTNKNEVDVDATQIDFTNIPLTNATASLNSPFAVVVEARDVNGNRDQDFTGSSATITALSNATGASMTNAPIVGTSEFVAGLFTFSNTLGSEFQFTSGDDEDDVTLSIKAGTGTTCGGNAICGSSPPIELNSSFESVLDLDPAFISTPNLPYVYHQATDITAVTNPLTPALSSFVLAQFKLSDGNGVNPDDDGAATNIQDLTLSITRPENIRKIALYIGSTEIQEKAYADFVKPALGDTTVTFTGLSANVFAIDNGSTILSIRASFSNIVEDNEKIQLRVTNVTQVSGSKFNNTVTAPPIGGVTGGAITDGNVQIEVTATKLDFAQQPPAFAGINEPVPLTPTPSTIIKVQARDQYNMVDLDFNSAANLSATAGLNSSVETFAQGTLNLPALQYAGPGDGTLTITANGLSTNVNDPAAIPPNVSVSCIPVNAIHVSTVAATSGVYTQNLGGGAKSKVIFGVTFRAPHTIAGEPKLNKFIITLNTAGSSIGVYENIKVFESTDNAFVPGVDIDVTSPGIEAKLTQASRALTVDFNDVSDPGVPRDLSVNGELTYFLMVDVASTANASTPEIQAKLDDAGSASPTSGNIITSNGSAVSAITGRSYNFAAVLAPQIVSSYPARGQLNVDINQPSIDLVWSVPVWTLDSKVTLHYKYNGDVVQELSALNGLYAGGTKANLAGTAVTPLRFALPTLLPDSVYYISIAPGNQTNSTGIMDEFNNLSPGFSFSEVLYFKAANTNPPKLLRTPAAPKNPSITNISLTGATVNGTFDQQGTAYFMVVPQGSQVPTNAQIRGAVYPGTPIRGSFAIGQINPISQFGLVNATLNPSTSYDVWICAESYSSLNGSLIPIPTSAPYGNLASGFAEGGAGPTLNFTTPAVPTPGVNVFAPIVQICSNSYQTLNSPIMLVEGPMNGFNTGGTIKSFNLLLPSGFQFDNSTVNGLPDGVPIYGTLTLTGADFDPGSGSLSFINNSILTVRYSSSASSSRDNITISGLRILATAATSGDIVRLGGGAILSLPDETTVFAKISSFDGQTIDFTNSYTRANYPDKEVTIIPDDYNQPARTVQLIPKPLKGDYGSSSFSGTGVNINQLNLSAVTLGVPFNVTITHTDNNGCVSQNPIQYTIYDHEKAIGELATKYCFDNTTFPGLAATGSDTVQIAFNNNEPASYMISLTTDIPANVTQIISGPDWRNLIQNQLLVKRFSHDPFSDINKLSYDYRFDKAVILNANDLSGGAIADPYSNFDKRTQKGNIYYDGGSLGKVEFTGNYISVANSQDDFPLKQNVEFFLPAIPIVEVDEFNKSITDTNDPFNQVPTNPDPLDPKSNNKGTPVFCKQGGTINFSGFPRAEGSATMTFRLEDAETSAVLSPPPGGFAANSNGTASINPAIFDNGHRSIRIVYAYKDNNSPCESIGSQVIRIEPNPIAQFDPRSIIGPNTPVVTAYCENRSINFNASASSVSSGTIASYKWNFNDAANTSSDNLNEVEGNATTAQNVLHRFATSARYNVSLTVTSNFSCASAEEIQLIDVGAIPVVKFNFLGISTADPIVFDVNASADSSQIKSAPIVNDRFKELVWNYDHGTPDVKTSGFRNAVSHTYPDPRLYNVSLEITSRIGCRNMHTQPIIVLARETSSATDAYHEDFENGDGDWQPSSLPTNSNDVNPYSWEAGPPTTSVITIDPFINGISVWKTSLSGTYNPKERSALYSPSIDISELARPMISFNSFTQMENSDGVVLEYSTDNKNVADSTKRWDVLGKIDEGVDWFTDQSILAKPGEQANFDYGWSGSDVDQWRESKHALTNDPGKAPLIGAANVVFRFSLASAKEDASAFDGFAIDNFRIGNRTRIVLLENFRNLGNSAADNRGVIETEESKFLNAFNPSGTDSSVVKINYHVAFPDVDPLNKDNEQDPGARALYYNVSQTPRVRMDGETISTGSQLFSAWGDEFYSTRSLKLADADIDISAIKNAEGSIDISVSVRALRNLEPQTILNVAIVERTVGINSLSDAMRAYVKTGELSFEYVMKKLLPSAAGTRFDAQLQQDATRVFGPFTWEKAVPLYDPTEDLAVVIFLQNEDTREIYQTEIADIPDPGIVTGIEDLNTAFKVYPNPADKEMLVELPTTATKRTTLKMFDQMGKTVEQSFFEKGETTKTITTESLSGGVYLIQIETEKGVLRRKVMVTHRN
jgi:hypothetical protein